MRFRAAVYGILTGSLSVAVWAAETQNVAPITASSRYEFRAEHDPDGIGKFYMGREIAHVMGHQAADWLERPERDSEEKPELLLEALDLKRGDCVADIGA